MTYLDENGNEIASAGGSEEYLDESGEPIGAPQTEIPKHPLAALGESVLEGGKGFLKGAGETAQGAGRLMNRVVPIVGALSGGDIAGAIDAYRGKTPGLGDYILPGALDQKLPELQAENKAQSVGKGVEGLAEAVASGGGGALTQAGKAALLATAKEGKVSPSALAAAALAAGTAGLGKAALKGSEVLNAGLTAKALQGLKAALGKSELPLVEQAASPLTDAAIRAAGGAALGGIYDGKRGALGGALTAAGLPALSKAGLAQFMKTTAGQRILASVLGKMGAVGESAAPTAVGATLGPTIGRWLAKFRDQAGTTSTEYARN